MNALNSHSKMKTPVKIIIAAVILILAVLFIITNCQQKKIPAQSSELQLQNERLNSKIAQDSMEMIGVLALNKPLQATIRELTIKVSQEQQLRRQAQQQYTQERNKLSALTPDESMRLFLNSSGQTSFNVLRYDTNYIVPLQSIKYHNTILVYYKEAVSLNQSLTRENSRRLDQINNLNVIVTNDSLALQDSENRVAGFRAREVNFGDQLAVKDKAIRLEKRKMVIYKVLVGLEAGLVVWSLVR